MKKSIKNIFDCMQFHLNNYNVTNFNLLARVDIRLKIYSSFEKYIQRCYELVDKNCYDGIHKCIICCEKY